jgi:hypothetical protein
LSDNPFWFVNEKLLVALLTDEFRLIAQLFAKYPKLREFFDLPEALSEQRSASFILLAHRRLIEEIEEKFLGMYQQPPSLAEEEKNVIPLMQNLFADDAPAWVLEANQVAELLPSRVYEQLPEPLRRGGGFYANDPVQTELIATAARELSSVEKIRALSEMVIDQQLKRLEGRWSASISSISQSQSVQQPRTTSTKQTRRTINREGWEQRLKLYSAIQNVLNRDCSLQGIEFCAQLDTRHAPPLYDWVKKGQWREGLTWKEAWGDPRLRKKIRRVRQEAMKSG